MADTIRIKAGTFTVRSIASEFPPGWKDWIARDEQGRVVVVYSVPRTKKSKVLRAIELILMEEQS